MVTEGNIQTDLSFNTQNPVVYLPTRTLRPEETNTKNAITRKMHGYIFLKILKFLFQNETVLRGDLRMTREGRGYGPPTNGNHQ